MDEDGGIYVLSRNHAHKLVWTGSAISKDPGDGAWVAEYNNDLTNGSGSTPSLMGFGDDPDKFVIFTDGNELMNVTLMWRNEIPDGWVAPDGAPSNRIAGMLPADMGVDLEKVQTEQSVVVSGYGALVVNNEPNNIPPQLGEIDPRINSLIVGFLGNEPLIQPYGMQKFKWEPAGTGSELVCQHPDKPSHNCRHTIEVPIDEGRFVVDWVNNDVSSLNAVPIVSAASDAVYTVGARNGLYTIEALDWTSGEEIFHWFVGGNRFNSLYSGIMINENGQIHYNTMWGKALFQPDNGSNLPIPDQVMNQLVDMLDSDPEQAMAILESLSVEDRQELAALISPDMLQSLLGGADTAELEELLALLAAMLP